MHPGGCSVSTLFYSQLSYHYHSNAPRLLCSQFSLHRTQGSGRHGVARQTVCIATHPSIPLSIDCGFSSTLHWGSKRNWNRKTKRKQKSLRKEKEKVIQRTNTNQNSCWCLCCLTLLSRRCKLWIIFSFALVWPWGIHDRFSDASQRTKWSNAQFLAGKTIRWYHIFK